MSSSALIVGAGSGLSAALARKCREAGMEVAAAPSLMIAETVVVVIPDERMARVAA
ncbi:MAG: hypothetical protein VW495_04135 [Rhodobiaceae bacterium]|jgi:NAD(P)-dependent dehydrogenase (short-subunit alcohol dehydrogenase family)